MEDLAANPLLSPGAARSLLLTRGLKIDASTLRRWAATGRLSASRMPSGHRRYRLADIERIATGHQPAERVETTVIA